LRGGKIMRAEDTRYSFLRETAQKVVDILEEKRLTHLEAGEVLRMAGSILAEECIVKRETGNS